MKTLAHCILALAVLWLPGVVKLAASAPVNSVFDPSAYAVITDKMTVVTGTIAIDTGNGSTVPPTLTTGGNTYNGSVVTNQSGNVSMALFNFGELSIGSSVSCTVTGNLGLVLASRHTIAFDSSLDLGGFAGSVDVASVQPAGGLGGAGAESGARAATYASVPPSANHGKGGSGGRQNDTGGDGSGYGAGQGYGSFDTIKNGGGAGYGGAGGAGYNSGGAAGVSYGNATLTDLYGGSGGGGSFESGTKDGDPAGGGGGGGGAVEFVASGPITLSGTVNVKGGRGGNTSPGAGGGSGGAIILAAPLITVAGGTLNAAGGRGGGDGGDTWAQAGGGGGGGRIVVYGTINGTLTTNVAGGTGGTLGSGYGGGLAPSGSSGSYTNTTTYPFLASGLPAVTSSSATGITATTAYLDGSLIYTGATRTVWGIIWGTNNPGATMAGWLAGGSTNLGQAASPPVTGSVNVQGLQSNTQYYFAYWATNAAGTNVAVPVAFTTYPAVPVISNAAASLIRARSATLNGYLASTGIAPATVYVYYGTNTASWSYTNNLGVVTPGSLSTGVSGLALGATYYYRFYATNISGGAWAPTTNSFTTVLFPDAPASTNSLIDPLARAPIAGSLAVAGGSMVIDTGDGSSRSPIITVGSTTYDGIVVPGQNSNVWLAVFNFGSVDIGSGVSCTVTGNLGLVLASRSTFAFGATLSLTGNVGSTGVASTQPAGGLGGAGAESGARASSYTSAPPSASHGNGGSGGRWNDAGGDGSGYGAGQGYGNYDNVKNGGGGGYGGAGGAGYNSGGAAGVSYGDPSLTILYGGSGGGGSFERFSKDGDPAGGGGGGGGAVEFASAGRMTFSGTINVNGGRGGNTVPGAGGGSGGGIILAAPKISFAGATLSAAGGRGGGDGGGTWDQAGAGGGGGRIAIYGVMSGSLTTNVAGATGGTLGSGYGGGTAPGGSDGTYTNISVYPFEAAASGGVMVRVH